MILLGNIHLCVWEIVSKCSWVKCWMKTCDFDWSSCINSNYQQCFVSRYLSVMFLSCSETCELSIQPWTGADSTSHQQWMHLKQTLDIKKHGGGQALNRGFFLAADQWTAASWCWVSDVLMRTLLVCIIWKTTNSQHMKDWTHDTVTEPSQRSTSVTVSTSQIPCNNFIMWSPGRCDIRTLIILISVLLQRLLMLLTYSY